jgi:hypothetical protein
MGRSRWIAPTVVAVFLIITIAWIGASIVRGPRVYLQGYLTITLVGNHTCVFVETAEAGGTLWTVVELPGGYSAEVEKVDPRFEPEGRITGPDGTVARYLDGVKLEGVPVPVASDDVCGAHQGVSALTIERYGFGP